MGRFHLEHRNISLPIWQSVNTALTIVLRALFRAKLLHMVSIRASEQLFVVARVWGLLRSQRANGWGLLRSRRAKGWSLFGSLGAGAYLKKSRARGWDLLRSPRARGWDLLRSPRARGWDLL